LVDMLELHVTFLSTALMQQPEMTREGLHDM
jgi:hypothetical protein